MNNYTPTDVSYDFFPSIYLTIYLLTRHIQSSLIQNLSHSDEQNSPVIAKMALSDDINDNIMLHWLQGLMEGKQRYCIFVSLFLCILHSALLLYNNEQYSARIVLAIKHDMMILVSVISWARRSYILLWWKWQHFTIRVSSSVCSALCISLF